MVKVVLIVPVMISNKKQKNPSSAILSALVCSPQTQAHARVVPARVPNIKHAKHEWIQNRRKAPLLLQNQWLIMFVVLN